MSMPSESNSSFPETVAKFRRDGFAVIDNFLTPAEVDDIKSEVGKIVAEMDPKQHFTIFSTGNKQGADDYFLNSADKIRFFFEADAFNADGQLKMDKSSSLNKIGHALHWLNPVFKRITFSDKVKSLVKEIGLIDPVVPQSMYIFKNPGIGGEVVAHQDATFLHTKPTDGRLIGIWLALEDATIDNGCLWFVNGSQNDGLQTQWVRTTNSDTNTTTMVLTRQMPKYEDSRFQPAPVKTGSCVVIDGLVVHKSSANRSNKSRPAYTFHVYDRHETKWDRLNWLQPTDDYQFPALSDC